MGILVHFPSSYSPNDVRLRRMNLNYQSLRIINQWFSSYIYNPQGFSCVLFAFYKTQRIVYRSRSFFLGIELSGGTTGYTDLFRELTVVFDSHEPGCSDGTGPLDAYIWRGVGYGSNVNGESIARKTIFVYYSVHNRCGRTNYKTYVIIRVECFYFIFCELIQTSQSSTRLSPRIVLNRLVRKIGCESQISTTLDSV